MLTELHRWLPPEGMKILLVLFLSFLTGLEREERKSTAEHYTFGGVRTFPLIGLIGYAMAFLSQGELLPLTLGFAVVGGFLMLSYRHKLVNSGTAGVTTEMSGLATYLVGALVHREEFWIATTLSVAGMLLLELKAALENLAKRIAADEIFAFTKFLLLTAVILPVLPNEDLGPFRVNPFRTWLVVVAVSGVSYGSYVIQKITRGKGGMVLAAVLGGAYSSTATTVVLSRRAARENRPHLFSAGILLASGMMYLRLAALLALFNPSLLHALGVPFALLAGSAAIGSFLLLRAPDPEPGQVKREYEPQNPLELRTALLFALLFVVMLVATRLAVVYVGRAGVYALGAVMGAVDVDPFIMGIGQSAGTGPVTSVSVGAAAVLVATSSNNLAKGVYAFSLADRATGRSSLILMAGLAVLGLVPLFWLA
jgi:uncharacterized membrane protein (DUF4010 family)